MQITLMLLVAASLCLASIGFVEAGIFKKAIVATEVQTLVETSVKTHMPTVAQTINDLKAIICSISKFWFEVKYHVTKDGKPDIKPVNLVKKTQEENAIKTFKRYLQQRRGKAAAVEFNNKVVADVLKEYKKTPEQQLSDTDKEYVQLDCLIVGFTVKAFCDDKNVINLQPVNVDLPEAAGSDAVGYVDDIVAQYTSNCGLHL